MSWLKQLRDNFARPFLVIAGLLLAALSSRADAPVCSSVFHENPQSLEAGYMYLGDSIRPHLMAILERSQESIDMEMSLAPNKELFDLFRRKREQGVKIRVVLDNRSANKSEKHRATWEAVLSELKSLGVEYAISDKEALIKARGFPGAVFHRKLILVDNKYFYVGSSNFTVHDMNQEMGYFGPTKNSADFKKVFESDFHAALDSWRNEAYKARENPEIHFKDDSVKLVGPGTRYPDLRSLLLQQIGAAQRQILISAYEATDAGILKALVDKKQQFPEIDIRVVLCVGKLPVRLWGKNFEIPKNARFLDTLMKAGIDVRVYGNETQYNHSRFGLFDDVVYGSSADFVQRSFQGSVDLGFIAKDHDLANLSRRNFDTLWDVSRNKEEVTIRDRLIDGFFQMVERINYLFLQIKLLAAG